MVFHKPGGARKIVFKSNPELSKLIFAKNDYRADDPKSKDCSEKLHKQVKKFCPKIIIIDKEMESPKHSNLNH